MRRLKSILTVLIVFSAIGKSEGSQAQERLSYHSVGISWGVSVPVGNSFLSKSSFTAPRIEWEWRRSSSFAFGLDAGFIRSSESGFTNDRVDGSITSGHSARKGSAFTLTAFGRWYLLPRAHRLSPYVGIGAGTEHFSARISGEVINTAENKAWNPLVNAEAGVRFLPCRNGRLTLDIRGGYAYSGYAWKYVGNLKNNRIGISLGVGYRFLK